MVATAKSVTPTVQVLTALGVVRTDDLKDLRDPLTTEKELGVATLSDELTTSLEGLCSRLKLAELFVTATLSLTQDGVGEGAFDSVFGDPRQRPEPVFFQVLNKLGVFKECHCFLLCEVAEELSLLLGLNSVRTPL